MLRFKEIYEIWKKESSLQRAFNDSCAMLQRTNRMYRDALRSLRSSDAGEIEIDIYEEDRVVNQYQRDVRRNVLRHLAVTGGINVVPGLILTTIVIDIERIGDYTKNIMELAAAYPQRLVAGRYEEDVQQIEKTVGRLFDKAAPILQSSDKEAARASIRESFWIRKRCDEIVLALIRADEALSPGAGVTVALYVRYLKRVGAHLMNVLSSVVNPFEAIGYKEE